MEGGVIEDGGGRAETHLNVASPPVQIHVQVLDLAKLAE